MEMAKSTKQIKNQQSSGYRLMVSAWLGLNIPRFFSLQQAKSKFLVDKLAGIRKLKSVIGREVAVIKNLWRRKYFRRAIFWNISLLHPLLCDATSGLLCDQ